MADSEKHHVIEYLFDKYWDSVAKTLSRTAITMEDVLEGIHWANANRGTGLSPRNPANFMKDVVRGFGASRMWPQKLKDLRWTAIQKKGSSHVFEFIEYELDQDDPFPNPYGYRDGVNTHHVQSLSIPQATKELGRDDETYLIQVGAKLSVSVLARQVDAAGLFGRTRGRRGGRTGNRQKSNLGESFFLRDLDRRHDELVFRLRAALDVKVDRLAARFEFVQFCSQVCESNGAA